MRVIKCVSTFITLHVNVWLFQDLLLERFYCFCFFVKDQSIIFLGIFLDSLFCPLNLFVNLLPRSHCFDYHSFIVSLEVGECQSSNFVLLPQHCIGYSGFISSFPICTLLTSFTAMLEVSRFNEKH